MRREKYIQAALKLSEKYGYMKLTLVDIANAVGVTRQEISNHCGKIEDIRREVRDIAVKEGLLLPSVQASVSGDTPPENINPGISAMLEEYNASGNK